MDVNKTLNDFIDSAQKSRKYMPNTASNFRSPLRLLIAELNEDEKSSVELVKKNLDNIFNTIYNKNNSKFSASSIEIYKSRIRNLIADYEKYGTSPTAMANWERPVITRKVKTKNDHEVVEKPSEVEIINTPTQDVDPSLTKHEELLTHGKAIIFTPSALEESDITLLRAYIGYLEVKIPKKKDKEEREG